MRDIQSEVDLRGIALEEVGISNLTLPISVFANRRTSISTVAKVSVGVSVAEDIRGTHMSRLVESAVSQLSVLSPTSIEQCHLEMASKLDAKDTTVRIEFDYFIDKDSPISKMNSPMRYKVNINSFMRGNKFITTVGASVRVTSLCPCSKEISDYGAHNQRGTIEIAIQYCGAPNSELNKDFGITDLVKIAENCGSAPLYTLVKRSDERFITMLAYDNPVFVEDIVRNATLKLRQGGVGAFMVSVTNDESIHDHNAFSYFVSPDWNWKYGRIGI